MKRQLVVVRRSLQGIAAATADKLEWLLGLANAHLGPLPIGSITAGEIPKVLQTLEAAGKLETAKCIDGAGITKSNCFLEARYHSTGPSARAKGPRLSMPPGG
jgi:hypothetical protein